MENSLDQIELWKIDELKLYFGEDYVVNDYITIHQPTIGEIMDYGEEEYFKIIQTLTCIPSDMKSSLWDKGYDWNDISDFELFCMLSPSLTQDKTSIVLGNLDLSKFIPGENTTNGKLVLIDPESRHLIDEMVYLKMFEFLCKFNNIKKKHEHAKGKYIKEVLIEEDREKNRKSKEKEYTSTLKELISAMRRYPGFNFTRNEILDLKIYEFMDMVQGAQIYVSSTALLQGSYSGMIDTSKIDTKKFNWLRQDA